MDIDKKMDYLTANMLAEIEEFGFMDQGTILREVARRLEEEADACMAREYLIEDIMND